MQSVANIVSNLRQAYFSVSLDFFVLRITSRWRLQSHVSESSSAQLYIGISVSIQTFYIHNYIVWSVTFILETILYSIFYKNSTSVDLCLVHSAVRHVTSWFPIYTCINCPVLHISVFSRIKIHGFIQIYSQWVISVFGISHVLTTRPATTRELIVFGEVNLVSACHRTSFPLELRPSVLLALPRTTRFLTGNSSLRNQSQQVVFGRLHSIVPVDLYLGTITSVFQSQDWWSSVSYVMVTASRSFT